MSRTFVAEQDDLVESGEDRIGALPSCSPTGRLQVWPSLRALIPEASAARYLSVRRR